MQLLRTPKALFLDYLFMAAAGLTLGVFFYGREYQPSFTAPYTSRFGGEECPPQLMEIFPPLCLVALMPVDDPIFAMSSLTSLAVSLSAITSSMRIFGEEKEVFQRESRRGLITGAYYIGKSLAHLPIQLLAPLVFVYAFSALTNLKGSTMVTYLILLCVYSCSAGIAYVISILLPRTTTHLAGILVMLTNLTLSGVRVLLQLCAI